MTECYSDHIHHCQHFGQQSICEMLSFPALKIQLENEMVSFPWRLEARESNKEPSDYRILLHFGQVQNLSILMCFFMINYLSGDGLPSHAIFKTWHFSCLCNEGEKHFVFHACLTAFFVEYKYMLVYFLGVKGPSISEDYWPHSWHWC